MMLIYICWHRECSRYIVTEATYNALLTLALFFFKEREAYVCIFRWKIWNDKISSMNTLGDRILGHCISSFFFNVFFPHDFVLYVIKKETKWYK